MRTLTILALLTIPALASDPPAAILAKKTVKVAAVQCSSDLGDVAGNTKKLTALVKEAAKNGAKFVVLPETAITGYLSQDLKTNWHVQGHAASTSRFNGKDPKDFARARARPIDQALLRAGEGTRHLPDDPASRSGLHGNGKDKPRVLQHGLPGEPEGRTRRPLSQADAVAATRRSRGRRPAIAACRPTTPSTAASGSASASTSTPSWRSTSRTRSGACSTRSRGWTPSTRPTGCSTGCPSA